MSIRRCQYFSWPHLKDRVKKPVDSCEMFQEFGMSPGENTFVKNRLLRVKTTQKLVRTPLSNCRNKADIVKIPDGVFTGEDSGAVPTLPPRTTLLVQKVKGTKSREVAQCFGNFSVLKVAGI